MRQTADVQTALCPTVERAFEVLGRKWAGLVIRELASGPRHFSELERSIPSVSARMLAERAKELEAEGIVKRTVHTDSPVRVVYELTEKGRALIPVMRGIESWARQWVTQAR
jgi:DNA-binding HxlR family transcriptional regulator